MGPKPLIDLTVSDINRIDVLRPPLQEAISKSTCGCTGIEGTPTVDKDAEGRERSVKFEATPTDKR